MHIYIIYTYMHIHTYIYNIDNIYIYILNNIYSEIILLSRISHHERRKNTTLMTHTTVLIFGYIEKGSSPTFKTSST